MDNIKNYELFNKEELKKKLGIFFNKINLLITFHPITLETNTSELHIKNLLKALSAQKNTNFIYTLSISAFGPLEDDDCPPIYPSPRSGISTPTNASLDAVALDVAVTLFFRCFF